MKILLENGCAFWNRVAFLRARHAAAV